MSYPSIFDKCFDVAVYGTGYAALAAAWSLSRTGKKVLLFGQRLSVAWESGQNYASDAGDLSDPLWMDFLGELERRGLMRDGRIDCTGAEIVASARLREAGAPRVLLGAYLLGVVVGEGGVREVRVGTKSGERTVRARAWIDASEEGMLLRLVQPEATVRKPVAYEQRGWFANAEVASAEDFAGVSLAEGVRLESSIWKHEFILCSRSPEVLNRTELAERILGARDALGEVGSRSALACFSVHALPLYESAGEDSVIQDCLNVYVASPALENGRVVTLGDRFALGLAAALRLGNDPVSGDDLDSGNGEYRSLPVISHRCEILVTGAGTGGAVAALTALEEGADVFITDAASSAGGVGTGGLISGYFHGHPGGYFEEYDRRSWNWEARLDPLLTTPRESRWHHEAKRLAFDEVVERERFQGESLVYDVDVEDGRVHCVRAVSRESILEIYPKAVIDGTGDGDVVALSGVEYDFGRRGDGFPLSYSQSCIRLNYTSSGVRIEANNYDAGWVDATDPEDLTRARLTAVSQYLRDSYSDDEHFQPLAPVLGVRQTRQFHTERRLELNDLISHTECEDSIGFACSPLDTHSIDYEFEEDETLFWLWGCKNFRGITYAKMPYGLIVPKGVNNLWLACRAAGLSTSAAYAVRMQRDVQRMGEAAGLAAVAAVRAGADAMDSPRSVWMEKLQKSGALKGSEESDTWKNDPLGQMKSGVPGGYLWILYRERSQYEQDVLRYLEAEDLHVSWLAAVVLSMWEDDRAEPRLIRAIEEREDGIPTPPSARGAYSQRIDVPNWFLAVNLLRMCGTSRCLPALLNLARQPSLVLDLRTSIALTLERLAPRLVDRDRPVAEAILAALVTDEAPDRHCRPSRSIYRAILGEEQKIHHDSRFSNIEDHGWRIALTVLRASKALGISCPADLNPWLGDERALVRKAFERALEG